MIPNDIKLLDDNELVRQYHAGVAMAFEELAERYHTFVLNICFRFLNDENDAKDAAQDIFVKVHFALNKFKPEAQFSTWLYRIAVNHCLNVLRSRKRKKWLLVFSGYSGDNKEYIDNIKDMKNNPEHHFDRKEKQQAINQALASLNDDYRTAVILHRYQGLSYKEISEVMGTSVSSIESKLFRAKKKLAELLKDYLKN
ncbi:sigma-70 family RNA polymerase sigma factor [candidate division KSB1 bacterium]|nr:sigma-70 family RNA polymerase sigma factor [candidate division KSB1 bacterium]